MDTKDKDTGHRTVRHARHTGMPQKVYSEEKEQVNLNGALTLCLSIFCGAGGAAKSRCRLNFQRLEWSKSRIVNSFKKGKH